MRYPEVMQSEVEAARVLISEGDTVRRRTEAGPHSSPGLMKKYSKLLLALVAVVSSLSFLIYKYRYDRLYHVMQVLEVFGNPDEVSVPGRTLVISPGWVGAGEGVWLYSAHCGSVGCREVTVLGLVEREDNTAVTADLQCSLWFEGSRQPLEGLLSVVTDDLRVSTFSCESKYPDKTPYAVAIYKGKAPEHRIQVQRSSKVKTKSLMNICVLPAGLEEGDVSKILVDSLVYHSLVGVDGVTLYSSGLPGSVVSTAENLMKDTNIAISVKTWSKPREMESSVISSLVSKDCYYASRDKFQHYVVLNSHQLVVPSTKDTLKETLRAFKRGPNKTQVKRFCTEYPTEKRAKNLEVPITVLEYTYYSKKYSKETVDIVSLVGGDDGGEDLENVISVNEYKDCDDYDLKTDDEDAVYDSSGLRYFSSLVKHHSKYT